MLHSCSIYKSLCGLIKYYYTFRYFGYGMNFFQKHISLFENYLISQNKENFINELNDPTEKNILLSFTRKSSDINQLRQEMSRLGFPSEIQNLLINHQSIQHLNTISEFKTEDPICQNIKEKYGSSNFEFSRPTTISSQVPDNAHLSNQDVIPSKLSVESTLQHYISNKIEKKAQFIRQLNDYGISKISEDALLALPLAERQYFLQKCGILFNYSPVFIAKFLQAYESDKRKNNDSYRLTNSILSCLTKDQLLGLVQTMPWIFNNQDYIQLWFNQKYAEVIKKYIGSSQNISKQEAVQKRQAFKQIIAELEKYAHYAIIKSYYNKLNSQILVLDIAVSDPHLSRLISYLSTTRNFNQISQKMNKTYRLQREIQSKSAVGVFAAKIRFSLQSNEWETSRLVEEYIIKLFRSNQNNEDHINTLTQYLQEKYLRKLNARVRLIKGQIVQNAIDYFGQDELKGLKQKKEIRLAAFNKTKYQVHDDVKLEVSLKNVRNIEIKVYELNLKKNLLIDHTNIDDQIILSFLSPTSVEYYQNKTTNPFQEVDASLQIQNIPKRIGVFIVDLQGEGITSRAVIRKGAIICLDSLTEAGQKFSFFDQDGKPLSETDGLKVWISGKPVPVTDNNVCVDYSDKPQYTQLVASLGLFAESFKKTIQAEAYNLNVGYIFNAQSFVVGKKAKILLHARLKLNQSSMSLLLLKDTTVKVRVTNNQNIKTFFSFDIPKWDDVNDQFIEFPIQSYIRAVEIVIVGKITLQNKKQVTVTHSKDISISLGEDETNFLDFYLERNQNQQYVLNLLGLNGETIPNSDVTISYSIFGVCQLQREKLRTNHQGKINLGHLDIVNKLSAEIVSSQANFQRAWTIDQTENSFNYTNTIHYKLGQQLSIPINSAWTEKDVVFLRSFDKYYSRNESSKLTIEKGRLRLPVINEEGYYILKLLPIDKTIDIITLKDIEWAGDTQQNQKIYDEDLGVVYEINKNSYQNITIEKATFSQDEQGKKAHISLGIQGLSKQKQQKVRVHVLASNYFSATSNQLFNIDTFNTQSKFKENKFFIKKSAYYSNKTLSDEGSYVWNRQRIGGIVGNNLEKPSIFLKKTLVRETSQTQEQLAGESDFIQHECAMINVDPNVQQRLRGRKAQNVSKDLNSPSLANINSHNNFLLFSGDLVSNLKGNTITVNIPEGYSQIEVLILTPQSAIKQSFPLKYAPARKLKDLRHAGLKQTSDKSGWTMSRQIYSLRQGQSRIVSRDSQWRTIGLSDIFNFASTKRLKLFDWSSHLLSWHTYSQEKKRQVYDKECCHQLNTFIKLKDSGFFDSVVSKFIKNKINKTFVDLCLLDDPSALEYVSINKLRDLNAFQKILLVHQLVAKDHKQEAKAIVQSLQLEQKSIKKNYEEFKNNFDTIINAEEPKTKTKLTQNRKKLQQMKGRRQNRMYSGSRKAEQKQRSFDLLECERPRYVQQRSFKMQIQKKGFTPIESTKQYTERTYYTVKNYKSQAPRLVAPSLFWAELSRYILSGKSTNFLSESFLYLKTPIEFILAASFISSQNSSNIDLSNEGENYKVTANVPIILCVKQVKELQYNRKFGVLLNQRYIDPANEYTYEEDGTEVEREVNEFIVKKPYISQTVVTNTSGFPLELQILLDIPKGTIPLKSHEYTQITNVNVDRFSSFQFRRFFYAPQEGLFSIYPSNASKSSTIISKSSPQPQIHVKTAYTINNLQSFDDILRSGDKSAILKFIQEKNIFDSNIFNPLQIQWMLKDKEFYGHVIAQLRRRNFYSPAIWNFAFLHGDLAAIREYVSLQGATSLQPAIFEYFPYYSSRTHQFANENKSTIRNVQFKESYLSFLTSSIIAGIRQQSDFDLAFSYYLILQDRLKQAQVILSRISKESYASHEIQVDYMRCFLDMSLNSPNFTDARDIAKKYQDYPLESWRKLFAAVAKTLETGDEELAQFGIEKKTEEYQTQVIQQIGQFKVIQPADTEILVEIFELNLELYYSTSPFYDLKAFTEVQPTKQLLFEKQTQTKEITIKRSQYPNLKDATIQITEYREGLPPRKVSTFTWSNPEVKVKINQNEGTLQVFVNKKRAAGSYVKVFADKQLKQFYRDGYTDMTGTFRYAMSDLDGIKQFSILVSTERGGVIQRVKPPSKLASF